MDQNTINQLLKLLGETFTAYSEGKPINQYALAMEQWMRKNAPEYMKNVK